MIHPVRTLGLLARLRFRGTSSGSGEEVDDAGLLLPAEARGLLAMMSIFWDMREMGSRVMGMILRSREGLDYKTCYGSKRGIIPSVAGPWPGRLGWAILDI